MRHGAGHTTLVFLDASGWPIGTLQGVQGEAYLREYIKGIFRLAR
jgi:hypothetical protein